MFEKKPSDQFIFSLVRRRFLDLSGHLEISGGSDVHRGRDTEFRVHVETVDMPATIDLGDDGDHDLCTGTGTADIFGREGNWTIFSTKTIERSEFKGILRHE